MSNIKTLNFNGEKLALFTFIDPSNRDMEVTNWHHKVHSFLGIPINYFQIDYRLINHGGAMEKSIALFKNQVDYFCFIDNDCLLLRKEVPQEIYEKLKDKKTIFGGCQNSNHIHINPTHPFVQPSSFCISTKLYETLGNPHLGDYIKRSDTCEEATWLCQENGYTVCMVYPSHYNELTDEECSSSGNPKRWRLTDTLYYGLGTTYGDTFFHAGMQGLPRSKQVFINKCKEVLSKGKKCLEGVVTCVGYGDILELTLPKNKKHFDNLIVVTDLKDSRTKDVCDRNGVNCIQSDIFYSKRTVFNKGGAINLAYANLTYFDWCINLDADIILPDNFRHSFMAHDLDENELYGVPRKFVWNYEQYKKLEDNTFLDEELLTLDGIGVGYFQAFNFKSNKIKHLPKNQLYLDSNTAEQVDIEFLYNFYPPPSPKVPRMFFDVIHLGPPGVFNNLKLNSKLASLKGLEFKDFPNVNDDEFFKDYPDIYNHKNKPEQKYNQYYKYFKNSINHRDFVFRMCLDKLNKKPAKILEIGTSRSLNGKAGDGWSTLFWCEYVAQYGGELNVCDVDQAAINVSKLLTENYHSSINVNFFCEDGIKYIDNTYDLIFLDGSDCPYQMLEQFEKIDRTKTIILCDDFHVKGTVVREKYKDFKLIKVNEIHEMAIYNKI